MDLVLTKKLHKEEKSILNYDWDEVKIKFKIKWKWKYKTARLWGEMSGNYINSLNIRAKSEKKLKMSSSEEIL